MSTLTSMARAQAVEAGRAQPICTVRHVHLSDRPLVLIPLALAGEACAPLAAMVGSDPRSPRLLIVPQPRDRSQRFGFVAELAQVVLPHIELSKQTREPLAGRGGEPADDGRPDFRYADAPQILVPNRAGIAFLRLLGRSTRFRRTEGEYAVPFSVPMLGRWLTFFADRTETPGSSLMLAATEALAMHWASGQSPMEDQNLAALVGWIDPPEGLTGFEAALEAEDPVRWPPAGPATDPTFDNEVLARLIAAFDEAAREGDRQVVRRARSALEQALREQLEPTWRLMWRTVELLRVLPEAAHVVARWQEDRDAFTWQSEHTRLGGPPQAKRDSAVGAATRLARLERIADRCAVERAYDDPLVMAESRMTGEAFSGVIVAAEPERLVQSRAGGGKALLRPLVTVQTWDPVQVEMGSALRSPTRPRQVATVVSVAAEGEEGTQVVLELAQGMGLGKTPQPGSVPEVGERLCYSQLADEWQPSPVFPDRERTPWTHGGPPVLYQPTVEDAQETWS